MYKIGAQKFPTIQEQHNHKMISIVIKICEPLICASIITFHLD